MVNRQDAIVGLASSTYAGAFKNSNGDARVLIAEYDYTTNTNGLSVYKFADLGTSGAKPIMNESGLTVNVHAVVAYKGKLLIADSGAAGGPAGKVVALNESDYEEDDDDDDRNDDDDSGGGGCDSGAGGITLLFVAALLLKKRCA
jgi:hypothetical protein